MNERMELVEVIESIAFNVSEKQDDGHRYATFLVSEGDKMNRNKRVYPTSIWQREATDIGKKNVTGQSGHPVWSTDLLDQFLLFTEGNVVGGKFYATAKVIPTDAGIKFATIVDAGVRVAVSTRGYGSVKKEEWTDESGTVHADVNIVQEDYSLNGIDVIFPGEQSVDGAKMIRFEATGKVNMNEMQERIEGLEGEVKEVKEELVKAKADAGDLEAEIAALNAALDEKSEEFEEQYKNIVDGLDEEIIKVAELKAESEARLARISAITHLLDKAEGEKFAMPIMVKLFDCETPQAVEDSWAEALADIERDLNDPSSVTPKGAIGVKPGDNLEDVRDEFPWNKPENAVHLRAGGLG